MKKMNLIFHTRAIGAKLSKGMMIFAMLFLFGFGFNTLSAQYVSVDEALANLTNANIEIMENWDDLQQSGNTAAIERATVKQHYLRAMLLELKEGSTVSETVKKFIATEGTTAGNLDYQIGNAKSGVDLTWLKNEILELLEL